jgi:hypothetical protein
MSPPRAAAVSPLGSAVDLPHLSPEEAVVLVDVLERICQSLWDTYGEEMSDLVAAAEPPEDVPPDNGDPDVPF